MAFSKTAATETSALLARLISQRSQESLASFLSFREALEGVMRTVETWANVETGDEVAEFVARLTKEAAAEARAIAEQAAEESRATIETLRKRVSAVEAEAQSHKEKAQTFAAESARMQRQAEVEAAERQKAASALEDAQGRLRAADEQRRTTAGQLSTLTAQIASMKKAAADGDRTARELQARLDTALSTESTLRHRIADGEIEIARARTEVQGSSLKSVSVDRLLAAFEQLEAARSVQDLLAALTSALAADFSRVALFNVKGKRLEGISQIGFDQGADISKIVIPLTSSSLFAKAIVSDRVEAFPADLLDDGIRAPFGGNPQSALALPVVVGGEALAVLYADDSGQSPADSSSPVIRAKFAELLRRHVVPCLEKYATKPERIEELSAYAALLLDELEYMYAADVSSGYKEAELHSRLEENLRSARQFYAKRVALEAPGAAGLFDERLSSMMAERVNTPFGRDLARLALRGDRREAV